MQIHVIFDVWCTCSTKVSLASFFYRRVWYVDNLFRFTMCSRS